MARRQDAEAGRLQAEIDRNAEAIKTRINALEGEQVKAAVRTADKIKAINEKLAEDITTASAKRGGISIGEADVNREIALLQDIAARKIEAIEKPVREANQRVSDAISKTIADLEPPPS